ncbi:hypothetical protein CAPTEDRAFT_196727 [Capitella teleta]|uniref:Uncharacterized protein n=1 Tax=Capitella teleta TaxID=283909 RepID=R7UFI9_CAPTE|nr:hypothetical protein CAPTEDRAFT_196727 [Capitella teleta]|eukprot:ELU02548.1 hypothetical protein CAPTEDRAFT_196727 [Capitella teleta]
MATLNKVTGSPPQVPYQVLGTSAGHLVQLFPDTPLPPGRPSTHIPNTAPGIVPFPAIGFDHTPLDGGVDGKTKAAIWGEEFVDFSSLVNKSGVDVMTATLQGSAILFQPGRKAKNLSSGEWLKAFFVYFTVYIKRYPNEATNLIKYANTIHELQATGRIMTTTLGASEPPPAGHGSNSRWSSGARSWQFLPTTNTPTGLHRPDALHHQDLSPQHGDHKMDKTACPEQPDKTYHLGTVLPTTTTYNAQCSFNHQWPRCGGRHRRADYQRNQQAVKDEDPTTNLNLDRGKEIQFASSAVCAQEVQDERTGEVTQEATDGTVISREVQDERTGNPLRKRRKGTSQDGAATRRDEWERGIMS